MKIFILLAFFLNFPLWAVAPLKDASVLHGKILGDKKCTGPAVIWVSKKAEILYQVESPINGSFEFHLVPGEYDIAATTSNGCEVKKSFAVAKNESKTFEIKLAK
ncbi:MAG: hypothetical protein A2X86_00390 [Bdellovibrionales bacterium GWA2_49_15]|nr:MAG: hypothetical protein A2X86_00390 [Bdellovibrionales bacterium GWA2_49_15]HAZ14501.1 hypothetical protein [Bdellovibrionales bacterium]